MSPLLEMRKISKSFHGVRVLKEVDFELLAGEVHALLGQNGAGKSTLIKVLSGAYGADSGEVYLDGQPVDLTHHEPRKAESSGIATVYQNFHLIPDLTVEENLYLHKYVRERGILRWKRIRAHARSVIEELRLDLDLSGKVKDLTVSGKQVLEIAIALSKSIRILIMDEPTAALSSREADSLFSIIRRLKTRGIGIIYISHKLEEIRQIGDRVTILRNGENVATVDPKTTETDALISLMVGKSVDHTREFRDIDLQRIIARITGLQNENISEPVSFSVRSGEILGVTGLVGAGKTELARAIYGADPVECGEIEINGKIRSIRTPARAVDAGLGYLPEDRDSDGLFLNLSVRRNISLSLTVKARGKIGASSRAERTLANDVVEAVNVKTRSIDEQVKYLSGGNKQKVILGRWLTAECTLLILDEPTIGIDVGARADIYSQVRKFVDGGDRSVLLVSSDMDEILAVCDRILVMSDRKLVAELAPSEATKEKLMYYSILEKPLVVEREV